MYPFSLVAEFLLPQFGVSPRPTVFLVVLFALFVVACGHPAPDVNDSVAQGPVYVGDASCASCHEDIAASFARTGMGRSLSVFDSSNAPEHFSEGLIVPDPNSGLRYTAFVRGDTLFQREWLEGPDAAVIADLTMPVSWVVGSGNATRSYLMNVNGFVTEAPLTWYVDSEKWDLSPGYAQVNQRFSRPINLECMTCHNSIPEHTPFTQNHYSTVPLGIGCERCHGPSSEHVERQLAGLDLRDEEIVHPATLDRPSQLAICQQCHLTGFSAFLPGEDPTTFRPGSLLTTNRVVFEEVDDAADENAFGISSHASQLSKSECFLASTMTCTTCHDPHVPVAELGPNTYNTACVSCHTSQPSQTLCARPVEEEALRLTGDCVSCHLQTGGTSDIPHVSFTDHWIRATLPGSPSLSADKINRIRSNPMRLVQMSPPVSSKPISRIQLEEAVAFFDLYETMHKHPAYLDEVVRLANLGIEGGSKDEAATTALARAYIEQMKFADASKVLASAVQEYSGNALLWYWFGIAKSGVGNRAGAVEAFTKALEIQPLFLDALSRRAKLHSDAGRIQDAIRDYEVLLAKDPIHHPKDWNNIGFLKLQAGDAAGATDALQLATKLDPLLVEARVNLGSGYLVAGRLDEAVKELETVLQLDPRSIPALGNLGVAYQRQGKTEKARASILTLLTVSPNDPNARRLLAELGG